jgi:single-strand DNA-binding protein
MAGQAGQDRYSTEVVLQGFNSQLVMLDWPQSGDAASASSRTAGHESWAEPSQPRSTARDEFDDEIPF